MSEMVKFNSYIFITGYKNEIFWIIENKKLNIRHLIAYPFHKSIYLLINPWRHDYDINTEKFNFLLCDSLILERYIEFKDSIKHKLYLKKSELELLQSEDYFNECIGIKIAAKAISNKLRNPLRDEFKQKFLLNDE